MMLFFLSQNAPNPSWWSCHNWAEHYTCMSSHFSTPKPAPGPIRSKSFPFRLYYCSVVHQQYIIGMHRNPARFAFKVHPQRRSSHRIFLLSLAVCIFILVSRGLLYLTWYRLVFVSVYLRINHLWRGYFVETPNIISKYHCIMENWIIYRTRRVALKRIKWQKTWEKICFL